MELQGDATFKPTPCLPPKKTQENSLAECLFAWSSHQELRSEHEEDLCKNETHYRTYVEEAASAEMMDPRLASCDTPCYTMPLSLLSSHETRLRDSSGYTIYTNGVLVSCLLMETRTDFVQQSAKRVLLKCNFGVCVHEDCAHVKMALQPT